MCGSVYNDWYETKRIYLSEEESVYGSVYDNRKVRAWCTCAGMNGFIVEGLQLRVRQEN